MSVDLLPDSRMTTVLTPKGSIFRAGAWYQPIFCANCGADGGLVPEENMTFAFYLCNPCFAEWGEIAGTMAIPDDVFWKELQEAQLERYGRVLAPHELEAELANPDSLIATLARSRAALTPKAPT